MGCCCCAKDAPEAAGGKKTSEEPQSQLSDLIESRDTKNSNDNNKTDESTDDSTRAITKDTKNTPDHPNSHNNPYKAPKHRPTQHTYASLGFNLDGIIADLSDSSKRAMAWSLLIADIIWEYMNDKAHRCKNMRKSTDSKEFFFEFRRSVLSHFYIYGGATRDYLLGNKFSNIDIFLNTRELSKLFINHLKLYHLTSDLEHATKHANKQSGKQSGNSKQRINVHAHAPAAAKVSPAVSPYSAGGMKTPTLSGMSGTDTNDIDGYSDISDCCWLWQLYLKKYVDTEEFRIDLNSNNNINVYGGSGSSVNLDSNDEKDEMKRSNSGRNRSNIIETDDFLISKQCIDDYNVSIANNYELNAACFVGILLQSSVLKNKVSIQIWPQHVHTDDISYIYTVSVVKDLYYKGFNLKGLCLDMLDSFEYFRNDNNNIGIAIDKFDSSYICDDFESKRKDLNKRTIKAIKNGKISHVMASPSNAMLINPVIATPASLGPATAMQKGVSNVSIGTAAVNAGAVDNYNINDTKFDYPADGSENEFEHSARQQDPFHLMSRRVISINISNPEIYTVPSIYGTNVKSYLKSIDFSINTLVSSLGDYWYDNYDNLYKSVSDGKDDINYKWIVKNHDISGIDDELNNGLVDLKDRVLRTSSKDILFMLRGGTSINHTCSHFWRLVHFADRYDIFVNGGRDTDNGDGGSGWSIDAKLIKYHQTFYRYWINDELMSFDNENVVKYCESFVYHLLVCYVSNPLKQHGRRFKIMDHLGFHAYFLPYFKKYQLLQQKLKEQIYSTKKTEVKLDILNILLQYKYIDDSNREFFQSDDSAFVD